jgi:hypothetical protein
MQHIAEVGIEPSVYNIPSAETEQRYYAMLDDFQMAA